MTAAEDAELLRQARRDREDKQRLWEREREQRNARRPAADAAFEKWRRFLRLGNYGHGLPAFERVKTAIREVREQRWVHDYRGGDYEPETLAVRVVADVLAGEIQAAAGPGQDHATIAWVVAGMRCPERPFCTGCSACFSITTPDRPTDPPPRSPL